MELEIIKPEKKQISDQLQNLSLETQLFSMANMSIERETEGLRDILAALNKFKIG